MKRCNELEYALFRAQLGCTRMHNDARDDSLRSTSIQDLIDTILGNYLEKASTNPTSTYLYVHKCT